MSGAVHVPMTRTAWHGCWQPGPAHILEPLNLYIILACDLWIGVPASEAAAALDALFMWVARLLAVGKAASSRGSIPRELATCAAAKEVPPAAQKSAAGSSLG